jgi:hypothetical protein
MYDNELKQEIVEAEDAFRAAISYLGYEKQDTAATTLEDLQEELWDSEEQINVLELKSSRPSWGPGSLPPIGQLAMQ